MNWRVKIVSLFLILCPFQFKGYAQQNDNLKLSYCEDCSEKEIDEFERKMGSIRINIDTANLLMRNSYLCLRPSVNNVKQFLLYDPDHKDVAIVWSGDLWYMKSMLLGNEVFTKPQDTAYIDVSEKLKEKYSIIKNSISQKLTLEPYKCEIYEHVVQNTNSSIEIKYAELQKDFPSCTWEKEINIEPYNIKRTTFYFLILDDINLDEVTKSYSLVLSIIHNP